MNTPHKFVARTHPHDTRQCEECWPIRRREANPIHSPEKIAYAAETERLLQGILDRQAGVEGDHCPTCGHPAMSSEGEVQPCSDPFHSPKRVPASYKTLATGTSPMHSFEAPSGRTYYHNGDFSGMIQREPDVPGEEEGMVISFEDIRALYLESLRRSKISALEQASADFLEEVARRDHSAPQVSSDAGTGHGDYEYRSGN